MDNKRGVGVSLIERVNWQRESEDLGISSDNRRYLELTRWSSCPQFLDLQPGGSDCMACPNFIQRAYTSSEGWSGYLTKCSHNENG